MYRWTSRTEPNRITKENKKIACRLWQPMAIIQNLMSWMASTVDSFPFKLLVDFSFSLRSLSFFPGYSGGVWSADERFLNEHYSSFGVQHGFSDGLNLLGPGVWGGTKQIHNNRFILLSWATLNDFLFQC